MLPKPLHLDTSPDFERLQIERRRGMPASDKAAVASGLTQTVYDLPLAGIRHRDPDAADGGISSGSDLSRRERRSSASSICSKLAA